VSTKFGFLSRFTIFQDLASLLISKMNPVMMHNLEKYKIIHHAFYLTAIEGVDGDYLEFGVFTGSSFCHAIRCYGKLKKWGNGLTTKFYGFDSFQGFGKLSDKDQHPFYTDLNFSVDSQSVRRRIRKIGRNNDVRLIEGFFSTTLNIPAIKYGIVKSRIIFIDCDTYESAADALHFSWPSIQCGTLIILDDFFAYRGSSEHGVAMAFNEFTDDRKIIVRQLYTYGMGGVVYVVSKVTH
jgi:O-methyltransferase